MRRAILILSLFLCSTAHADNYFLARWQWSDNCEPFDGCWKAPEGAKSAVDLRSIPSQTKKGGLGGFGVFAFDGNVTQVKSGAFITSDDAAALEYINNYLTKKSDSNGITGPKPLMPDDDSEMSVTINGHDKEYDFDKDSEHGDRVKRVWVKDIEQMEGETQRRYVGGLEKVYGVNPTPDVEPLDPHTTYSDTFNRADSSNMGASWTEVVGDMEIKSNAASIVSVNVNAVSRYESDLSSANHYSSVTISGSNGAGSFSTFEGACARFSSSATTAYVTFHGSPATTLYIWKLVSGTYTLLTSTSATISLPEDLKLDVNGSAIKVYINGVQKISITDTAITGNLRAGMYLYQQTSGQTSTIDYWEASDGIGGAVQRAYII